MPFCCKAYMIFQKGQYVPLRLADMPRCQPANDKSWHGKDAHAISAPIGKSGTPWIPVVPLATSRATQLTSLGSRCLLP